MGLINYEKQSPLPIGDPVKPKVNRQTVDKRLSLEPEERVLASAASNGSA